MVFLKGFLHIEPCHLKKGVVLLFRFRCLFFFLSFFALDNTSMTVLNSSDKREHSYLLLGFRRKTFSCFALWLIHGLSYIAFIVLRWAPPYQFSENFCYKSTMNFVKYLFLHLLRWSCGCCLSFCLYDVLHWFSSVEPYCSSLLSYS